MSLIPFAFSAELAAHLAGESALQIRRLVTRGLVEISGGRITRQALEEMRGRRITLACYLKALEAAAPRRAYDRARHPRKG